MRVALVCDAFLPEMGGLALQLRDLALALRAREIDARIITAKGAPDGQVPVHRVPSSFTLGRSVALKSLFFSEGIDVVHSHVVGLSPLGFTAATASARASLPTVLTFQTMLDRTSALLGASDALLGWTRGIVLTAVSSVVAAQAARALSGASVGILPPGIDARYWRGGPKREPSKYMHFVSVLDVPRDDPATSLVRAFATAVRFVAGSPDMRLTIVGEGAATRNVRRLAAEFGIGQRVALVRPTTRAAQRDLYADADIFVLPGAREVFGVAALEARAAGLPVIAMLSSGARDFITPGLHGLLARDEAELARFMSRLAVEDPLRRFIANRNRTETAPCDWPLVAEMHRAIYDAAVALREAPAPASQA
ncbi:MAG: glycosyltransferase [bacterium]